MPDLSNRFTSGSVISADLSFTVHLGNSSLRTNATIRVQLIESLPSRLQCVSVFSSPAVMKSARLLWQDDLSSNSTTCCSLMSVMRCLSWLYGRELLSYSTVKFISSFSWKGSMKKAHYTRHNNNLSNNYWNEGYMYAVGISRSADEHFIPCNVPVEFI